MGAVRHLGVDEVFGFVVNFLAIVAKRENETQTEARDELSGAHPCDRLDYTRKQIERGPREPSIVSKHRHLLDGTLGRPQSRIERKQKATKQPTRARQEQERHKSIVLVLQDAQNPLILDRLQNLLAPSNQGKCVDILIDGSVRLVALIRRRVMQVVLRLPPRDAKSQHQVAEDVPEEVVGSPILEHLLMQKVVC